MKMKKAPNSAKKDWQKKIEKKVEAENVELGHPQGKERFETVVKRMGKKK